MKSFFLPFLFSFLFIIDVCAQQTTTIVVAANMRVAMDSLLVVFKTEHQGDSIRVIYGSSGKFYEQIRHNAPFDLFFSADMSYPEKLKEQKWTSSEVKQYAVGQLALWSKKWNPKAEKLEILLHPSIKKIAVANPKTAPYGAKAIESLQYFNLYENIKSKLVYGENIAQTAQFVSLGAADIGIIALSDALSPRMKSENGFFVLIPKESHQAIKQGCVLLKRARNNQTAHQFFSFISTEKAKAVLSYFGYAQE